jgi:hypothetical protein
MTALTAEQIAELERLEKAATPGPWRSLRDGNQYVETSYIPTAKCVGASRVDGPRRPWNPHALLAFGFKPEEYERVRFIDADADLVAGLRNAAPALLRAAAERNELWELVTSLACITEDTAECPFCNYEGDGGDSHDADCNLRVLLERFAKP